MQFYQFLSYHAQPVHARRRHHAVPARSRCSRRSGRGPASASSSCSRLLYPRRDVMAARWELEHGDARAKASACEYLDNVLSGPLRRKLMPMLEELTDEERVTKGNVILRTRPRDVEETLLILDQQRRRGRVGGGDRSGRPPRAALARRRPRARAGATATCATGTSSRRRPGRWRACACRPRSGARCGSSRCPAWRSPAACGRSRSSPRSRPTSCSAIARTGRQVRLDRGHTLYEAGALPSHVHLLLDGQVRATASRRRRARHAGTRRRSASKRCSRSAPIPRRCGPPRRRWRCS